LRNRRKCCSQISLETDGYLITRKSIKSLLHFGVANGIVPQMDQIVTMDRFGRLVIPRRIREALAISRPTSFNAEMVGGKVELTPITPKSRAIIKNVNGVLVVSTGGKKFNGARAVRIARELICK